MGRRAILSTLGTVAAMLLACRFRAAAVTLDGRSDPRRSFIRITLDVETPEGLKSGSSVVERTMIFNDGPNDGFTSVLKVNLRGQATVVDLGSRGLLFCVFERNWTRPESCINPSHVVDEIFHTDANPRLIDELNADKPQADIPFPKLPLLVRFRDIGDPRTIEVVDPGNLASSFGPGVRLARATVAITDGPVTTGIEHQMPDYRHRFDWRTWRRTLPTSDPRRIGPDVFRERL